jgi:hypothetical protein
MIQKDKADWGKTGEEQKINRWEIFLFCHKFEKNGVTLSPRNPTFGPHE